MCDLASASYLIAIIFPHQSICYCRHQRSIVMKRKSHLVTDDKTVRGPWKHRLRRRAPKTFRYSLLDLPPEVRHIIFQSLLLWPEPLEFHPYIGSSGLARPSYQKRPRKPRLHVSIMRTCQQLHQEGVIILYSNVIKIQTDVSHLHPSYTPPCCAYPWVLAPRYWGGTGLRNLPKSVCTRISKICIEIVVRSQCFPGKIQKLEKQIRGVADLLTRNPAWVDVTIAFRTRQPEQSFPADIMDVLRPLRSVRGRHSVSFKGTDAPNSAADLIGLMTSIS